MVAETPAAPVWEREKLDKSATRVDTALLAAMLFLQRFTLPIGDKALHLDLVAIGLILFYQFFSGKLVIQYDRLLWFLTFAIASTCSLLFNFKSTMLTSYAQTVVFFSLFTLSRSSSPDQYKKTVQAFQFLVMVISSLAIVQFPAQFVVDSRQLINFYGIVPDILLGGGEPGGEWGTRGAGTIRALREGLIKSNGIFITEPSGLSQLTALGILIEVLEFRRPRYLLVMSLGFLFAYSGTGVIFLLLFLPLASLRYDRVLPYVLLVVIFALGFLATGIIDLSAFTSRTGEFQYQGSSGYDRFVSPLWSAAAHFDMEALQALLLGSGPGTAKYLHGFPATWVKIFHEYGIIGSFIFVCFLAGSLRRSRCPGLVVVAQVFAFLFLQGSIGTAIVLCTLNRPGAWRVPIDANNQYRSSLVAEAETVRFKHKSSFMASTSTLRHTFNQNSYQQAMQGGA